MASNTLEPDRDLYPPDPVVVRRYVETWLAPLHRRGPLREAEQAVLLQAWCEAGLDRAEPIHAAHLARTVLREMASDLCEASWTQGDVYEETPPLRVRVQATRRARDTFYAFLDELCTAGIEMGSAISEAGSLAPPAPEPRVVTVEATFDEAAVSRLRERIDTARRREGELWQGVEQAMDQLDAMLGGDAPPGLAFDAFRSGRDPQAIIVDTLPPGDLWFIGDLHGDLLALEAALLYIDATSKDALPPTLAFLGDLFDDGGDGLAVTLRVLRLAAEHPDRTCLIAGNHDEALAYDEAADRFTSSVEPSDFADTLNASSDPLTRRIGRTASRLFDVAPRALFLPDGLLVSHGGFPHSDLWEQLNEPADLSDPACLRDFVWTRCHPRRPTRIPNRATRGCEWGWRDFAGFCEVTDRLLPEGRAIRRLVRGHDHIADAERYDAPAAYGDDAEHGVLTINTLSRRLDRELSGPPTRAACIARHRPGRLPEVHLLRLPERLIEEVYGGGGDGDGGGGGS